MKALLYGQMTFASGHLFTPCSVCCHAPDSLRPLRVGAAESVHSPHETEDANLKLPIASFREYALIVIIKNQAGVGGFSRQVQDNTTSLVHALID